MYLGVLQPQMPCQRCDCRCQPDSAVSEFDNEMGPKPLTNIGSQFYFLVVERRKGLTIFVLCMTYLLWPLGLEPTNIVSLALNAITPWYCIQRYPM